MRKPKRRFTVSVETLEGRLLMSAAPQFTVTDLGPTNSVGNINSSGQVVGQVSTVELSGQNGESLSPVFPLGSFTGVGISVNDHGQILLRDYKPYDDFTNNLYFISKGDGSWPTLILNGNLSSDFTWYGPSSGPSPYAQGNLINNLGNVVGATKSTNHAIFYDGTVHDIGTIGGFNDSRSSASGVNDSNQITGWSDAPYYNARHGTLDGFYQHAFFYDGTMHDLGTLGGHYSYGNAINELGQVVGISTTASGHSSMFISDPNGGTLHDIGNLPDAADWLDVGMGPSSVNKYGHVVGFEEVNSPNLPLTKGFYYDGQEVMDLNNLIPAGLGYTITTATGINNSDQISVVGYSTAELAQRSYQDQHAFLLTPVPQPPTITWSNPADIVYGTPLSATQLNATADVPGTFTYNVAAGTVLHAGASQTLEATFTPTDTSLYTTATKDTSINVLPAPLTVTANNATKIYGQPLPTLTGTITGLVNGDTDTATYSTTATTYSPTGTYPITPTLTDSNYNVTFVNGTLTQAPVRLFVESYYLARYPNVATIVASGRYPSAFAYFKAVGVYMGDMATPDWTPAIEQTYLTANPDVARAVTSGSLKSGYEHFFLYGQYQNRAGAPPLT